MFLPTAIKLVATVGIQTVDIDKNRTLYDEFCDQRKEAKPHGDLTHEWASADEVAGRSYYVCLANMSALLRSSVYFSSLVHLYSCTD